jgi:hypothetical protein
VHGTASTSEIIAWCYARRLMLGERRRNGYRVGFFPIDFHCNRLRELLQQIAKRT